MEGREGKVRRAMTMPHFHTHRSIQINNHTDLTPLFAHTSSCHAWPPPCGSRNTSMSSPSMPPSLPPSLPPSPSSPRTPNIAKGRPKGRHTQPLPVLRKAKVGRDRVHRGRRVNDGVPWRHFLPVFFQCIRRTRRGVGEDGSVNKLILWMGELWERGRERLAVHRGDDGVDGMQRPAYCLLSCFNFPRRGPHRAFGSLWASSLTVRLTRPRTQQTHAPARRWETNSSFSCLMYIEVRKRGCT